MMQHSSIHLNTISWINEKTPVLIQTNWNADLMHKATQPLVRDMTALEISTRSLSWRQLLRPFHLPFPPHVQLMFCAYQPLHLPANRDPPFHTCHSAVNLVNCQHCFLSGPAFILYSLSVLALWILFARGYCPFTADWNLAFWPSEDWLYQTCSASWV